MDTQFLRRVSALVGLGCLFGASILPAAAQDGPKLYVFTSGSLGGFPKAALQIGGNRQHRLGAGQLLCDQASQGQRDV